MLATGTQKAQKRDAGHRDLLGFYIYIPYYKPYIYMLTGRPSNAILPSYEQMFYTKTRRKEEKVEPTRNTENRTPITDRSDDSMATDVQAPPSVFDNNDDNSKRKTYPQQDWAAYNQAQVYEKEYFLLLMSEVVDLVIVPEHPAGRPRHSLTDIIKCMIVKVYGQKSTRRSMTDLREAHMYGYINTVPHYNTIIDHFSDPDLTPIMHDLIQYTSFPLRNIESNLAIDSSGFSTSGFLRWHEEKHGKPKQDEPVGEEEAKAEKERKMREWLKLHIVVGERTQTVVSATVEGWSSSDYRQFIPLFARVPENFNVREISADGAYLGRTNMEAAELMGAKPYIPYHKRIVQPNPADNSMWAKMFWMFHHRQEEWKSRYHRRSKVETAFSTIKRVFGPSVRSRNHVAQVNEVLLKVLCHNIVVLVHEMHELGVYPEFVDSSRFLGAIPEEAILDFVARRGRLGMPHKYNPDVDRQYRRIDSPDTTAPHGTQGADAFGWPYHDPTLRGPYDGPLSGW